MIKQAKVSILSAVRVLLLDEVQGGGYYWMRCSEGATTGWGAGRGLLLQWGGYYWM